jgi:hypothetical protein
MLDVGAGLGVGGEGFAGGVVGGEVEGGGVFLGACHGLLLVSR